MLFIFSSTTGLTAQVNIDNLAGRVNGVWWTKNNILDDAAAFARLSADEIALAATTPGDIKNAYPATVGVFATLTWKSLAKDFDPITKKPDYQWSVLDNVLKSYSDSNLLIILMVWAGPDCPAWITDDDIMDVPPVNVTESGVTTTYPYYFHVATSNSPDGYYAAGEAVYQKYWHQMLRDVAAHVKAYSGNAWKNKLRRNIVIVQSAEGSTGDEGPYGGATSASQVSPSAYFISRNNTNWVNFRRAAWKLQDSLYNQTTGIPVPPNSNYSKQIHLLINCDPDDLEDQGWLSGNVPDVWRKANSVGHGYQINDERIKKQQFDSLINKAAPYTNSLTKIRCRDEMDQYKNPWQAINERQYNMYQAAYALYFGLDIWPNTATGLLDTADYKTGFDFFNKYAGFKTPQTAPGGFCVLHTGLDAADTVAFPTALFGSGTQDKNDAAGKARCVSIAQNGPANSAGTATLGYYSLGGAAQDDPDKAQAGATNQYRATGLNDVGWNIFKGNYERYLTQIIDTTDITKNGWSYWRISTYDSTNVYGRFAKGFRHGGATGPRFDSLFFRIDDSLFTGARPVSCTLRIVYYDSIKTISPAQAFRVHYDAVSDATKQVTPVFRTDSTKKWVERLIPISDGKFEHRGPHGADIVIANAQADNEIFALIEIIKQPPPSP